MDCTSNPILVDDFIYTDFSGILTHDLFDSTSLFPNSIDIIPTNSPPLFSNGTQQFTLQSTQPPPSEPHKIKLLNFGDYSKHVIPNMPLNPDEESALVSQVLTNEGTEKRDNRTRRDRLPSQTYDHIISERKRRKLLSQRFHVLSGMVPGLKKMDKTSVLGETIEYLQALQERVETLEKILTKETVESAVLVRKSYILMEGGEAECSHENNRGCNSYNQPLPEIEAKVCGNQALLRIHCEKRKGIMVKILSEVEKLNLTVLHSNVSPFGNLALDITIIMEMDKESTLMAKEIVHALHSALKTAT